MQRLLRKIPPLRYCIYSYALKVRQRRKDGQWAYTQAILMAVGNMTITWAGVERLLDELIAWYQHGFTDLSKEHPRSLSNKLKYLRLMQCDKRFPDEFREFLRMTRIEAKRIGDSRHELIHGMLHKRGGPSELKWRTQRVIYDGPNARILNTNYNDADLQRISREISDFSHQLSPKVWVITHHNDSFPFTGEVEKTLRELGLS